ncbi:MAG: septal ring lytic transglycosylase RlpA family protein [Candidatus Sulfotelmatobacter sp.]
MKLRRAAFVGRTMIRILLFAILLFTGLLFTGCGHREHTGENVPPPPSLQPSSAEVPGETTGGNPAKHGTPAGKNIADLGEPTIPAGARPLATEIGVASWYGPPYDKRRGSNGEVYNMHAMTAAHRTLPLGSIVRVTNLKTGHTVLVRITDRGPFIPGRVLDLSLAAARKVDVYLPGIAEVKVEVMEAPAPIETGGKWAVQIGGFPREQEASKLANHLARRYRTAKVQSFVSPAGDWWVRVRVPDDDRRRAKELAAETRTPEGAVFLVRLD